MNNKTYNLIVILKYLELLYNLIIFGLMIFSCTLLSSNNEQWYIIGGCDVVTILAGYHCFYNTLLTNIRYDYRNSCLGVCVYKILNWIICRRFLKNLCTERFYTQQGNKNKFFLYKWIINYIFSIPLMVVIFLSKNLNQEMWEISEQHHMPFESLVILYLAQHVIFILLRPVLFLIWLFTTCLCDCQQSQ